MNIQSETLRYMGVGRAAPDDAVVTLVNKAIDAVTAVATYREASLRLPLVVNSEDVTLGSLTIKSAALARFLVGCDEGILMAATLGAEADRLLLRAQSGDIALAHAMDAAASALLEARADESREKRLSALPGARLTHRFSPGYGDWSLDDQDKLLSMLGAGVRRIGLATTAAGMLAPTKSITALMGIARRGDAVCGARCTCASCGCSCDACEKTDCAVRR
jgi:hypothetical protein